MQARILLPALALVLLIGPANGAAQGVDPTLRAGDRVRVTHRPAGLVRAVGRVVDTGMDSATVDVPTRHVVPVSAVEVSIGVRTNGRRGMRRGLLAGLALGIVAGYVQGVNRRCDDPTVVCAPPAWFSITGGVAGAAVGGLLGGLIGRQVHSERWVPVVGP